VYGIRKHLRNTTFVIESGANGAGFYLQLSGEPSIYISGDTVYTKELERSLKELKREKQTQRR